MKKYVVTIGALALAILVMLWVVNARVAKAPGGVACTMEAKLCPDGSAVGRIGPSCEFAECPTATATSTTDGGTTTGGSGILPYNSGVRGTISLGPTCPVMRNPPDSQCADRPYQTNISVSHTGSSVVFATGKSDTTGAFSFSLPPGNYTLTASGGAILPRCNQVEVAVAASGYATADISCDTGIR